MNQFSGEKQGFRELACLTESDVGTEAANSTSYWGLSDAQNAQRSRYSMQKGKTA
jgi:hypothetical protein